MSRFAVDGPGVFLPARVCAVLEQQLDVGGVRTAARARGDMVVHEALQAMRAVAMQYVEHLREEVASDARSAVPAVPEVAGDSETVILLLGTSDAASAAGVGSRAVTLAANEGRLKGVKTSGRWWFTPEDIAAWATTRGAA